MTDTSTRPGRDLVDPDDPQVRVTDLPSSVPVKHRIRELLSDPRTGRVATVATFLVTSFLFFFARSAMWMDEAQTVAIARRSVPHGLFHALREDGSPPLFYLLLHGWMDLVGTGTWAIRSLSGIFALACLPLIALVAKRIPALGVRPRTAALLIATSPFVVRYATEARMYSLELLLVLLAILAFEWLWREGGVWPTIAAGVATGALLLNQYWSLYLMVVVGGVALLAAIRGNRRSRQVVLAVLIGAAIFVPWLPSFLFQAKHTGAPWAGPPAIDTPILALGNWVGTGTGSVLLRLLYYAFVVIAIAHVDHIKGGLAIRRPLRRLPAAMLALGLGTLLVGTILSEISHNAYATRYTMVVVPLIMLTIASGLDALPRRYSNVAVSVVTALGLAASISVPYTFRTAAPAVASVLKAGPANSLIVFCPDQIGPAVHRLVPTVGEQVVYPTFKSSEMVDWVDYKKRNDDADPDAFAQEALKRAAGRPLYYVYLPGYAGFSQACNALYTDFTVARGTPTTYVEGSSSFEHDQLVEWNPTS